MSLDELNVPSEMIAHCANVQATAYKICCNCRHANGISERDAEFQIPRCEPASDSCLIEWENNFEGKMPSGCVIVSSIDAIEHVNESDTEFERKGISLACTFGIFVRYSSKGDSLHRNQLIKRK